MKACAWEHCVGTYADRCLFDGTNIVSLRKIDGRSVSTAELRLTSRGKRMGFDTVQHKAHRNAAGRRHPIDCAR